MDHLAVIGLGFGDEGKGAWVDRIVHGDPSVAVTVRFNGGAQAAHNVVGSRHHTFRSFGSATFSGVPTLLDQDVLVDPFALAAEAEELAGLGVAHPLGLLHVHREARVVTPWHALANRARELARGRARHGSCGLGIGETAAYARSHPDQALYVRDLARPGVVADKLHAIQREYAALLATLPAAPVPSVSAVAGVLTAFARTVPVVGDGWLAQRSRGGRVVFEGAQGVLLDEDNGFHPHTTWSHTGALVPDLIAAREGLPPPTVLGVTRTYHTRHGAGPFPTEQPGHRATVPAEVHNGYGEFQGSWRTGPFDAVLAGYAARAAGRLDGLLISHVDAIPGDGAWRFAAAYRLPSGEPLSALPDPPHAERLEQQAALGALLSSVQPEIVTCPAGTALDLIADAYGAPVWGRSTGPGRTDGRLLGLAAGASYAS